MVDSAPTLSGGCGDINLLGITGTPVIDPATDEIFVAEETVVGVDDWQDVQHWVVAVSLVTHKELWHRQVDPPDGNQASHYYIPACSAARLDPLGRAGLCRVRGARW